jgi:hypothetical protein
MWLGSRGSRKLINACHWGFKPILLLLYPFNPVSKVLEVFSFAFNRRASLFPSISGGPNIQYADMVLFEHQRVTEVADDNPKT